MKFKLEIDCDNSAFDSGCHAIDPGCLTYARLYITSQPSRKPLKFLQNKNRMYHANNPCGH